MNSLKKFFKASPPADSDLAIIPSGQLYLKRKPGSPKSESECLYTDSAAIIRELSAHKFELIIQKVYAEGEEQLKGDDDDDSDEMQVTQSFIIDQSLKIYLSSDLGSQTVSWKNPEDEAESFQFVVDETVKSSEVGHFLDTVHACCFERKYQKSSAGATTNQLDEFFYDPEIEALEDEFSSGIDSLIIPKSQDVPSCDDEDDSIFQDAEENIAPNVDQSKTQIEDIQGENLFTSSAELRLYDPETNIFQLQDSQAIVTVSYLGDFNYWLGINSTVGTLGTSINSSLGPQFSYEKIAFVFNYAADQTVISLLLKFDNTKNLESFQKAYMAAQWENANRSKYAKIEENERTYILSSFNSIEKDEDMKDYSDDEGEDEDQQDGNYSDEKDQEEAHTSKIRTGVNKKEFSDSEEDDDDHNQIEKQDFFRSSKNSNLTVSYKNDRSYVTRGDRIGFFKVTEDDDMEFITSVKNLSLDGKKSFAPSKMMLHTEDRSLVLQGESKDTLYKMDIERGQIVENWKIKEDLPVVSFGPSQKFNQMTAEQTFIGISGKGLFKVDPRVSGQKLVESESKTYSTKNDFSSFSTTENGHIAVASNKGDVRLYDRLGIRAKSLIPAIGDPVRSTDVSADGKWVLLTCQTYLILLDTTIKSGNDAGKSRFVKSSAKEPPKMKVLRLSAEHTAFITNTTKHGLSFSHARFNTGLNSKEQTIISSTGPYAISWSLKKILRGDNEPYLIKRYDGNIVDDNFRFGSDKNVIVALEDDVSIVKKREFRKANRNSLAFTPRRI